ncbi:MAG: cytochrome P460 [Isosphaera sp.]|nr:cytochrome P460 [Isosphaera sp.]
MRTRLKIGLAVAAGVCATVAWFTTRPIVAADDRPAAAQPKAWVEYTADGKVKQPVGYRKWVFLGTPLTPNDMNGGEATFPEFHNVYMDPDSFAHLEKTGEYRDGTVLVKELTAVGTKELSSGKGYFQGEFTGLEISVKDAKRFKDEPGNWAYFSFGHKYPLKAEAARNNAASCNKCHADNAKNFVFSDVYPALNAVLKTTKKK